MDMCSKFNRNPFYMIICKRMYTFIFLEVWFCNWFSVLMVILSNCNWMCVLLPVTTWWRLIFVGTERLGRSSELSAISFMDLYGIHSENPFYMIVRTIMYTFLFRKIWFYSSYYTLHLPCRYLIQKVHNLPPRPGNWVLLPPLNGAINHLCVNV